MKKREVSYSDKVDIKRLIDEEVGDIITDITNDIIGKAEEVINNFVTENDIILDEDDSAVEYEMEDINIFPTAFPPDLYNAIIKKIEEMEL